MRCNKSGQNTGKQLQDRHFVSKKGRTLWGIAVLFLCSSLGLSALEGSRIDKNYLHHIWQYEDGLPQNTVQAVIQTRDGYVWAGTQNGLARFDGVRFVVFNPGNTPELKNPGFSCFLETKDGSLWIGTDGGGLNRFQNGEFSCYSTAEGLTGSSIRSLCETRDGTLWVGTTEGVFRGKNGRFSLFETDAFPSNCVVRSFCEGKAGRLWFAVNQSGLFYYENGKIFRCEKASVFSNGAVRTIRVVFEDSKGDIWFGSTEGLHRMKPDGTGSDYVKRDGIGGIVTSIFEDSFGNLWIGTYGGLNRYSNGKVYTQVDSRDMPLDVVNGICPDSEGNLWVGTKDGLNRLKPRLFHAYTQNDGLDGNNIMAVLESRQGGLWVASWGGGVNLLKDGHVVSPSKTREELFGHLVLGICETRDQTLWAGLDFDHGVVRIKNDMPTFFRKGELLQDSAIKVIFEDSQTNLWIGTRSALYLNVNGSLTRFTQKDGLASDHIRVIMEDRAGTFWFGTAGGLTFRKGGKFSSFTTRDGLSANTIASLYEDQEGSLWIGTVGGGLNRYRNGKFTAYRSGQGLFRDDVFDIIEDDFHYLWMTCRFGIYRVHKREFDDLDAGRISAVRSTSFSKHEGLISLECNSVAKPSVLKTKDGHLWFCTAKGLVTVDPARSFKTNNTPPRVLIEDMRVDRKPVSELNSPGLDSPSRRVLSRNAKSSFPPNVGKLPPLIEIPPGHTDFEFHYTALSFSAPAQNRFKYKLEGFDNNWVDAGNRHVAYYSNLRPGRYIFHVEGCNSEGVWGKAASPITIQVLPHFYQTTFFVVSCAFGVIFCGFAVHGMRIHTLRQHELELTKLVEERTKSLKKEIVVRQKAQAEIDQVHKELIAASRKAGMAEVASGVLHNIGNVLNSVNVAATCVSEQLRNSRQVGLKKVAAILQEHEADLPNFFANDPRSKQIPEYLARLSEQLGKEQGVALKDLEALRKNIDHIKDIVAMQQNYARAVGVVEAVDLCELIEDALSLNAAALARHDVHVIRDFKALPTIVADKHKILQILINLIRNAKYACDEAGRPDKRLTVSARTLPNERVRIVVADNGVGIQPENLTRIFSHGFTTRAKGHGFGLHSSALAAKELGGTLTGHSDGPGCGAIFTLEIPINPEARP